MRWSAVALAALTLAGCGGTNTPGPIATAPTDTAAVTTVPEASPDTTPAPAAPSVAEKLATLQKNSPVSADDPLVRKFDVALDALGKKCKDRRSSLADLTVRAQQILSDASIEESLSSIISHVNGSIPAGIGKQPCTSVFAAYVTLRKGG